MFALGVIAGLVIAVFISTLFLLFKFPIEQATTQYKQALRPYSVEPKGDILMPISDAEEVRQARIKENSEKGLDTYFDELV